MHALLFCQDHRACEPRKHFSVLFTPFFEDFLSAQPFLLQQVNNQLVHNFLSLYSCVTPNPLTPFLSQQNTRLFFFFLRLWIYLWLAETSQEPISQTTWLKVTPHCNHCMWPMSWGRWTCSERGACSFNLPRPSSLWAEETLFLSSPFFEDFSAAQPFLLQQVNNQLVHDFLSQQNNRLFLFL